MTNEKLIPLGPRYLPKSLTGIEGLDLITEGGLPKGRCTLLCGGPGCGKTLLAMEFLFKGATQYNEPGVFMAFEETGVDLINNTASFGWDLSGLVASKKLTIDYVSITSEDIIESGNYNLDALFIRLGAAIDAIGAKRVVLDTIGSLFATLENQSILRSELRRLFRWLKDKGVTAIITSESGDKYLSRDGLEEYVSDCVILLNSQLEDRRTTRRLQVIKYRGSRHGGNQYPFIIDESGISLIPITSQNLNYEVTGNRISTGIPGLDAMMSGKGFFVGSSILISGSSGTGKSSFMAHFANSCCENKHSVVYFAFEESRSQIIRNMRSIGIDLDKHIKNDQLDIITSLSSQCGLDLYLIIFIREIERRKATIVILDPVTSLLDVTNVKDMKRMLVKFGDYCRSKGITLMLGSLTPSNTNNEAGSFVAISSLIDTWIILRDIELEGERNRGVFILKSRGMAHSNQVREFILTDHGVKMTDRNLAYGGLVGSARIKKTEEERISVISEKNTKDTHDIQLDRKRLLLDTQITALKLELEQLE